MGDCLLVGICSDQVVRILKGQARPVHDAGCRAGLLASLESVTAVYVYPEIEAERFLLLAKPYAWVKGSDYTIETLNTNDLAAARKVGAQVVIAEGVHGLSSTRASLAP